MNKCDNCIYKEMCSYEIESPDPDLSELEQHLMMCGGCACGDGYGCNKNNGFGCSNYEPK